MRAASKVHEYTMGLVWDGNRGAGTSDYASYGRRFRVTIEGKADIVGSADPAFRGEPHLHNPEELLLAAVASCHMLTYLALCARNGITVVRYSDAARGSLAVLPSGGGSFDGITLQPRVAVARGSDTVAAAALHERAHELCFIANSCNFPIRCQAEVQVEEAAEQSTESDRTRGGMRKAMRDLAVRLENRPGALAEMGEALAEAGVSVEGGGAFVVDGRGFAHFLVADASAARAALAAAGIEALADQEVLVQQLDQAQPGELGKISRRMAEGGVNIEALYSDHENRLILVVDDLERGRRVSAAWTAERGEP